MKQNAVIVSKSSSVHYDTVSSEIPYLILVPVAKTLIQHTGFVQTKAKITRIRKEENQLGVNVLERLALAHPIWEPYARRDFIRKRGFDYGLLFY